MIELLGTFQTIGLTLMALLLGELILRSLGSLFGLYTIVEERECKVYVLFGKVLGVLDARAATMADLGALPYTDGVVHEALRMYPPAWSIGRETLCDFELQGVTVKKGDGHKLQRVLDAHDPGFASRNPVLYNLRL